MPKYDDLTPEGQRAIDRVANRHMGITNKTRFVDNMVEEMAGEKQSGLVTIDEARVWAIEVLSNMS